MLSTRLKHITLRLAVSCLWALSEHMPYNTTPPWLKLQTQNSFSYRNSKDRKFILDMSTSNKEEELADVLYWFAQNGEKDKNKTKTQMRLCLGRCSLSSLVFIIFCSFACFCSLSWYDRIACTFENYFTIVF